MSPVDETALLVVPGAQLHNVEGGVQRLLSTGDFSVALHGDSPENQTVRAQVGPTSWNLGKHLPALKAAPTIYSFGLEHTRAAYYILILPPETPAPVLDAVEDVVASSCALSNVRQVDAAFERADQLSGGKAAAEAAALAGDSGSGAGGSSAAAPAAGGVGGGKAAPGSAAATGYAGTPAAVAAAGAPASLYPPVPSAKPQQQVAAPPQPQAAVRPQQQQQPTTTTTTTTQPVSKSELVAGYMVSGSVALAGLVKKAGGAAADAVARYKDSKLAAGEAAGANGQPPARISPHFRTGIKVVGAIASGAAYVTGKLAGLVGDASYALALKIAKALPGHGPERPAAAGVDGELAPEERSAFKTIGAAGLTAYVNVYDALEDAAKAVLAQSADASAQYIHFKYGPEAGAAAAESVPVAQDMLSAATNFTRLGARALISKTAKRTAKIYLKSTCAGLNPDEQAVCRRQQAAAAANAGPTGGSAASGSPARRPAAAAPAYGA